MGGGQSSKSNRVYRELGGMVEKTLEESSKRSQKKQKLRGNMGSPFVARQRSLRRAHGCVKCVGGGEKETAEWG